MCKNSNESDCIVLFSKVCFRSTHSTFSRSWFLLILWVTRWRFYLTREDWRNQTCLECLGELENTDYTGKWSRFVELSKRLVQFSLDNFSCKFLLTVSDWSFVVLFVIKIIKSCRRDKLIYLKFFLIESYAVCAANIYKLHRFNFAHV